jgi:hypothetical protein
MVTQYVVFYLVDKWVDTHPDEVSEEDALKLLQCIDFKRMLPDYITSYVMDSKIMSTLSEDNSHDIKVISFLLHSLHTNLYL